MASLRPGNGLLTTTRSRGRTVVTRARAASPLRLLCPRRPGPAAWVYTSSYGGGLVAGDHTTLEVEIQPGSQCVLGTQASTKVYRSKQGRQCRQELDADVGSEATLVVAPDPITCFADAWYEQRQTYRVQPGGNLVLVDWVTSGRRARNECWKFARYATALSIEYDGTRIVADALVLDPQQGALRSPYRVGRFHCLATMVVLGTRFAEAASQLLEPCDADAPRRNVRQVESVSAIQGGVILRVAGMTTEGVFQTLQQRLLFLEALLGETPWSRKW